MTIPAFMVTANGVVIHCTHKLYWSLGHSFEDVHKILKTTGAVWEAISPRTDKPAHSIWLDYEGDASGAVLEK
jgi:hypothetical protein